MIVEMSYDPKFKYYDDHDVVSKIVFNKEI